MKEPETLPIRNKRGRPKADAAQPRDRLLDAAARLFAKEGYHAIGIERILADAAVAKMTLYTHFASKDELIAAVLKRQSERAFKFAEREMARRASDARGQLLALFDILSDWFAREDFYGCLFMKAASEFPLAEQAPHVAAADHKRRILSLLTEQAALAGAPSPRLLAQRLLLLVEGATVVAQVLGGRESARQARDTAALLLRQMLPAKP